mgnify:CR=1 FL=1
MTVADATAERRRERRIASSATLTFVPFTTRKVRSVAVQVLDCSLRGVRFRSPHRLKTGQTICLHTRIAQDDDLPPESGGGLLKSFALAEVCWCREDYREGDAYRIGVRYL